MENMVMKHAKDGIDMIRIFQCRLQMKKGIAYIGIITVVQSSCE